MNVMYCILFSLNLRLKYVKFLFLFFCNTCRYSWILKKYVGTHITDTRHGYGYGQIFIHLVHNHDNMKDEVVS